MPLRPRNAPRPVLNSPLLIVRLRTAPSLGFDSQTNATWLIWKTMMLAAMSFRGAERARSRSAAFSPLQQVILRLFSRRDGDAKGGASDQGKMLIRR